MTFGEFKENVEEEIIYPNNKEGGLHEAPNSEGSWLRIRTVPIKMEQEKTMDWSKYSLSWEEREKRATATAEAESEKEEYTTQTMADKPSNALQPTESEVKKSPEGPVSEGQTSDDQEASTTADNSNDARPT
ncbi:hypothetical protein EV356DRAFT_573690 [Viridothelium virens]|uniref:Uncharacterized protein n=1 Tax=Viridothelium virens TaxID=1048519 RepID=A0A6A6HJP8_VIRVR|nr:hypothetical protein EV356DRAFT_573690 [Viridothelium virens]